MTTHPKWKFTPLSLLAGAWALLLVLWPYPSDLYDTQRRMASVGEGLYKADLTRTSFGLLGVRYYETVEGRKNWKIRSRFAELNRKENFAFLQEVDSEFYARNTGNIVWTRSDHGRSYMDRNRLELEGNVNVRSKRGYLFTMRRLDYEGDLRQFDTSSPVQMLGPDAEAPVMHLAGVGMRAFLDKEHFIVKRKVQAKRKLSTSEWLKITSNSGEFFTNEEKAIFVGSVKSQLPELTIRSKRFEFNVANEKEFLLAEGSVTVHSRDRKGRAQKAEVEVGQDAVLLLGDAEVVTDGNVLRGDRITLHTSNDQVEVHRAIGSMTR